MLPGPIHHDSGDGFTDALVDVVDALDALIGGRIEHLEARLQVWLRRVASAALVFGVALVAAAVVCVATNFAIAALVATHAGVVVAAAVVGGANAVLVGLCFLLGRSLVLQPTHTSSGERR